MGDAIIKNLTPFLARLLTLSFRELMGQAMPTKRGNKRGPTSRLHQQIDAIEQLPKAKQQFDTVLAQGSQ
jgi:hypothetical protein